MADEERSEMDPIPVEGKPKEESDPLEHSLLPAVDSQEAEETARLIHRQHFEALEDRSEWEARLADWEDQVYGRMPPKDFPWPGAANFHVPLTMTYMETYKPRLIEAILGSEPPIQVVPIESADQERQERVEMFLNWAIRTEMDVHATVAESAHIFLSPGTVFAKTTWEVNRRHRSYVREFAKGTSLEDIFNSLWGDKRPESLEKAEGKELTWHGTIAAAPKTGGPLDVEFTLKFLDDGIQVLVEEEFATEKPKITLIDPPDLIMPARGGSDIQDLPWLQHRMWVNEDFLRTKVREGRFDKRAVEDLLAGSPPSGDRNQTDSTQYREGQAATEGIEDQGPSNARKDQYELLEDYRFRDVNEDGHDEHLITWYCKDLPDRVLGWDLVDNVYAHGRRPIRIGRFYTIPFRTLGLSLPEIVKGINDEADTIHNQRIDNGTITNLPFFFYRASSTLAPFPARLKPGEGVPLDNPQADINVPKWGSSLAWGQQEEALLLQYGERLTGLTDLSLGRQPTRVGATRTAAGTSQLLSESGLRQKTALEEFQRFWTGIFEDVLALYQEYLPAGKEFRVTGKLPEYVRLKDRTEIQGRYDLRLTMTTQTMNRVVAREDAAAIMQALMNPAFIQANLVGLKGIGRSLSDLLRAYGKDPDAYLEIQAVPKSPEEELAMLVSGGDIKPVAGEDVAHHLSAHQEQNANPMVRSVLKPQGVAKLQRHIQETVQLAQAQQFAQTLMQQGGKGAGPRGPDQKEAQAGQQAPQPNQQPGTQTNLTPTPMGGQQQ